MAAILIRLDFHCCPLPHISALWGWTPQLTHVLVYVDPLIPQNFLTRAPIVCTAMASQDWLGENPTLPRHLWFPGTSVVGASPHDYNSWKCHVCQTRITLNMAHWVLQCDSEPWPALSAHVPESGKRFPVRLHFKQDCLAVAICVQSFSIKMNLHIIHPWALHRRSLPSRHHSHFPMQSVIFLFYYSDLFNTYLYSSHCFKPPMLHSSWFCTFSQLLLYFLFIHYKLG